MNVSANETARCGASAPVPEKKPSVGFKIVDCILIAGILLPLLGGIVIRVLTHPVESGISITGAVILAEFDFPLHLCKKNKLSVRSAKPSSLIRKKFDWTAKAKTSAKT